ncbi:receptor-like serine/threonine-protein kinase At3g01300 isoform X1 [Papaver somniferum]|uniref:receptor-like serine/threonine-protein kinase At3g01300 isoform X1 n=2 Tax=Papaver somniferum TaxID=3469 RepID=UPI000E70496C|nr:receptor-like serine/threonine-protein kinase At3g01300 isoform X1 [Papaver somniferum]
MTTTSQTVVVIQDASRDISFSAITWAEHGLLLKPGDRLILLGVLHQVNTPSTLSFMRAGKFLGYKSKVDSSSMFGANRKVIEEEVARKKEEYHNNVELMKISNHYAEQKILFEVEVKVGSSPKMVAVEETRNVKAAWVILDRQMKKDKKYFTERLSCGIYRMKRDNNVEKLRGPVVRGHHKAYTEGSETSNVTYDEMVPGRPDEDDLFSNEFSPRRSPIPKTVMGGDEGVYTDERKPWSDTSRMTSFSKSKSNEHLTLEKVASSSSFNNPKDSSFLQEEQSNINIPSKMAEVRTLDFIFEDQEMRQRKAKKVGTQAEDGKCNTLAELELLTTGLHAGAIEAELENSICTVCMNKRPNFGWMSDFTYAELQAATGGFSPENFLSEGGFGSVYRGKLGDLNIGVKQLNHASLQGEKEFKAEVHALSKARHKHVVMLLGSCSERSHRLLVYEFVCNGSLDKHLSDSTNKPLRWEHRMKIALGAAEGLDHLHENNIIHRDVRPNNILVTHDYEPLLGDFGLARTQHAASDHSSETRVVGTFCYLAPEYAASGKVSTKTDVFSFGVVLLQLITGLRTTDKKLGEKSLVGWARPLLKERKYPDLIDKNLIDSHDVLQLFWMVPVAENCLRKNPDKRFSMKKVLYALTYLTNRVTVSGIEDFFPSKSYYASGLPQSNSWQNDGRMVEQESDATEIPSGSGTSE